MAAYSAATICVAAMASSGLRGSSAARNAKAASRWAARSDSDAFGCQGNTPIMSRSMQARKVGSRGQAGGSGGGSSHSGMLLEMVVYISNTNMGRCQGRFIWWLGRPKCRRRVWVRSGLSHLTFLHQPHDSRMFRQTGPNTTEKNGCACRIRDALLHGRCGPCVAVPPAWPPRRPPLRASCSPARRRRPDASPSIPGDATMVLLRPPDTA